MTIETRQMTFEALEAAPSFDALQSEYSDESHIAELGPARAQMNAYKALAATGALRLIGAFHDGELIGFVTVLASALPHYGVVAASTESFFVGKAHRKGGAGLALRRAAEDAARDMGAAGLFISAPADGPLADVLGASKAYRETNRVFFRGLA